MVMMAIVMAKARVLAFAPPDQICCRRSQPLAQTNPEITNGAEVRSHLHIIPISQMLHKFAPIWTNKKWIVLFVSLDRETCLLFWSLVFSTFLDSGFSVSGGQSEKACQPKVHCVMPTVKQVQASDKIRLCERVYPSIKKQYFSFNTLCLLICKNGRGPMQ